MFQINAGEFGAFMVAFGTVMIQDDVTVATVIDEGTYSDRLVEVMSSNGVDVARAELILDECLEAAQGIEISLEGDGPDGEVEDDDLDDDEEECVDGLADVLTQDGLFEHEVGGDPDA